MIFSPVYYREQKLDERFEMLSVLTDDKIKLEGVVYEPENPKGTLLFFAGRSQDSVGLITRLSQSFPDSRIITFNYRGYGKSKGFPSEKNIFKDGIQIAQLIQKNYGDFYILGFSLGSSVSAYVASQVSVLGVFLIGSFDTIASLAKEKFVERGIFPMIDLNKVFRYKFDNKKHVQGIEAKTYLFVSRDDETTYIQNARKLKTNIKNLEFYVELNGLTHKELLWCEDVINKINGEV
ncbi:alpha/beta hydrolase [Sulfurimonas sp.]|nr:alpha/beta hydrolase [Sulfurimonas sp.]